MTNEIEDRRQRAREAFADSCHVPYGNADTIDEVHASIESAIETATRVQVTREVMETARVAGDFDLNSLNQIHEALTAALIALGLEVVE